MISIKLFCKYNNLEEDLSKFDCKSFDCKYDISFGSTPIRTPAEMSVTRYSNQSFTSTLPTL